MPSTPKKNTNKKSKLSPKITGADQILNEPLISYTTRLRAIGNSKGVILNNQLIESAGIKQDLEIVIQARDGIITIMQSTYDTPNTDLSTWDKQFKTAMRKGAKPDKDMFEGMENDFDKKEW